MKKRRDLSKKKNDGYEKPCFKEVIIDSSWDKNGVIAYSGDCTTACVPCLCTCGSCGACGSCMCNCQCACNMYN